MPAPAPAAAGCCSTIPWSREPPPSAEEQCALLREREPVPEARLAELAARRLAATREALTQAGTQPERVIPEEAAPIVETDGDGRVDFTITDEEDRDENQ